ncbi:MAG: hypothetical protein ORN85_07480 [Sediminibacterium sp.]|nr:hypothetical protein [Sediminibacterium sp.]
MNLNPEPIKNHLPKYSLPILYSNQLISPRLAPALLKTTLKPYCIIVSIPPKSIGLSEAEQQLLKSILMACNMNINDFNMIYLHQFQMGWTTFNYYYKPEKVLLFALPEELNRLYWHITLDYYTVINKDNVQLLFSAPINGLLKKTPEVIQHKKHLWNSLKSLFNVS